MKLTKILQIVALSILGVGTVCAQTFTTIFTDNFDSGASPLWGNDSGSWVASNGVYYVTAPDNFPAAVSSLPFNLTDFTLDLDINGVTDGGIFLRSTPEPGTAVGIQGVLLVLNAGSEWFDVVTNGTAYGPQLNQVTAPYAAGSNPHFHIEVSGNTYSVFSNGSATPDDTLTTSVFTSGGIALYSNSGQTFDNVVLQVPTNCGPATATPEVVNGFVVGATVTYGGCGYTNTPLVLIQSGGGTGATATAVVSSGVVVGITITDAGIGYTNTPAVLIGSAPSITSEPQSVTVNAGDNASFNVTATGFPLMSYQWSLNGTNISGATDNSLTVSNVVQTNLGTYAVVISNAFGTTNSDDAILSMYPVLAVPFTGAVGYWGEDTPLSVQAWGSGPLSYQWFDNGAAILNATNQTLDLSSIQFTKAGLYSVVVSDPFGSVTNPPEQVVVKPAIVSLQLSGFTPTLTIQGVTGYSYIIQSTADLSNSNSWVTMTNLTLTQRVQNWMDTSVDASSPSNSQYFYQILPGQQAATGGGSNFPTSGLVLFAKFSEGSGNTVADSSGNGHTGYLTNSPAWIPGVTYYALNFVSASQQSAGFGDLNLAGSNQCTFSIWMQKTNPADIGLAALGCTSGTYNAIFLAWWDDGYVYGGVGFTNAGRVFDAPYVANTWVHFVMVYDGTQLENSNRINIFINGVPATPSPDQSWAQTPISTSIGMVSTNFSLSWDSNEGYESGRYDGVGVWNRVLSAAEIQQVYSNAAAGP